MYRDKKRMEFLNLVQGDDQTVAEYELLFAALAKYAPEAIAMQEDHYYHFEQGYDRRSEEDSQSELQILNLLLNQRFGWKKQ